MIHLLPHTTLSLPWSITVDSHFRYKCDGSDEKVAGFQKMIEDARVATDSLNVQLYNHGLDDQVKRGQPNVRHVVPHCKTNLKAELQLKNRPRDKWNVDELGDFFTL